MTNKSWHEKFNRKAQPVVKPCPRNMAGMKAGQRMLLPTARQFDAFIRGIPKGKAMPLKDVRAALAAASGAEVTCPIVTGFEMRTIAELVNAALQAGTPPEEVTPVWRVLDSASPTLAKLDAGPALILAQRQAEGLPA